MAHPTLMNYINPNISIGDQNPSDVVAALEQLVAELDNVRRFNGTEPIEERLERIEAVALLTATAALKSFNYR